MSGKDEETLKTARERFRSAQDAFREQRDRIVEDFAFSNPADPQQWDKRDLDARRNNPDGARVCLTLDHTNQYLQQVVNDARQNKPAINYLPSGGGARQEVAAALDGVARHIEYQSSAQIAYDTAIDHSARGGLGWIRLAAEMVDEELNQQEIRIKRIVDPLSVIADPDWQEPDGSDIRWAFVETSISLEEYKRRYGDKSDPTSWSSEHQSGGWMRGNSVRIVEYFERVESRQKVNVVRGPDGEKLRLSDDEYASECEAVGTEIPVESTYTKKVFRVIHRVMSGAEILDESEFPSRFIPVVPVIGHELWIEGKRYLCGMVRRMREAQRAYNYERSAWVEAVALQPKAPFMAAAEAVEGHEAEWGRANKANLAYLPWNAYDAEGRQLPMPSRTQPPTIPAAFAQGAQQADNDIQAAVGMYRASLGAPSSEHSGRAIMAKQREGDTANFHILDNQSRSIERVGRIVLDMIPRLYDEPREARILGTDGSSKPVRIDINGEPYAIDGEMTSINPASGTYDVRVKAGPSYTTLRQEAADGLTQMMQGNPGVAQIVAPIWARMQDWPEADKLSKALLAMAPPPVQQALGEEGQQAETADQLKQKLQQQEQQLEQMHQMLEKASSKLQELHASAEDKELERVAKAAELEIREYEAETKRLQVMGAGMTPQQVQQIVMQLMQDMARTDLGGAESLEQEQGEPQEMPMPEDHGADMPQEQPAELGEYEQPQLGAPVAPGPDLAQDDAMNEGQPE